MIPNYFKIALRHLTRHKLFSAINILCLAIGITFTMLIGAYVLNEKNVNAGIKNLPDQYVLKSKWKDPNMGLEITTLAPLAQAMRESYPNLVAGYYRYNPVTNVVSAGENHFKEHFAIGDTTLVSMYGFTILYGNQHKAFTNNNSAVITESLAVKLFGKKDVVNKTITITNTTASTQDFTVSAVLATLPKNSVTNLFDDEGYDVFLPYTGSRYYNTTDMMANWSDNNIIGLLQLQPGIKPADLVKPFANMINTRADKLTKENMQAELSPVKAYYLTNNNGAVQKMITTLSFVAGFILLMAIINFININIGTSAYRLKEIGLRKVFGGDKKQLIIQYITESLVLTTVAAIISLALYQFLLPVFCQLMNTSLPSFWQFGIAETGYFILLVLCVGILSGIYPAFVLSTSNTINAIKGKMDSVRGGLLLRKSLLVVQFTLAIVVFINALTISKQVAYCFTKDLGYNKDQVLVVSAFPKQWDSAGVLKMETIIKEFKQVPTVKNASLSFEVPDRKPPSSYDLLPEGSSLTGAISIPATSTDGNFANTFGLSMKEGSFFETKTGYIPGQIVLNESAVKALQLTYPVIGKKIRIPSANASLTVAGVVKDYHYSSFQEQVGPVVFVQGMDVKSYRYISVKMQSADLSKSIASLKERWKQLSPSAPFDYFFMDEKFQSLYRSELQLQKAAGIATWLTLIIVFMGIFGVVTFTLTKRTKEIAMRKVLGADTKNIISLFLKDYALLILIANLIAWPLAFIITNKWLENYVYRVDQSWGIFILVAAITFMASFALITLQCYQVALANPVKGLRTE